ncbi:MAG: cytidine deaminase family protein [Gemmatimonadales bacterium]
MTDAELIAIASGLSGKFTPSEDVTAGGVAAALVTARGHVFTGICVDASCSLGFCAEHAAIAEMLKARESEIRTIVAVNGSRGIAAPCGRCRELIWQVSPRNAETRVLLAPDRAVLLRDLLPAPWRAPAP